MPTVEHATSNTTQPGPFPEEHVVEFKCDHRYRTYDSRRYVCKNGVFEGSMTCKLITCGAIKTPENGKVANNPDYTVSSLITFRCDPGYDMSGQASVLCRIDGQWDRGPPICKAKNCGEFGTIANAKTFQESLDGVLNDYNSEVRVECDLGYILNGVKNVRCQEDGTWGDKPTCKEIKCPPYPGINSNCLFDSLLVGQDVYIVCKDDVSVTKVGGHAATCGTDEQWDDLSLACYCDCNFEQVPANVNLNNLNDMQYLPHNSVLEWGCEVGFEKQSMPLIECVDGKVNATPVCNKVIIPTTPIPTTVTPETITGKPIPKNWWKENTVIIILLIVIVAVGLGIAVLIYKFGETILPKCPYILIICPCINTSKTDKDVENQPMTQTSNTMRVETSDTSEEEKQKLIEKTNKTSKEQDVAAPDKVETTSSQTNKLVIDIHPPEKKDTSSNVDKLVGEESKYSSGTTDAGTVDGNTSTGDGNAGAGDGNAGAGDAPSEIISDRGALVTHPVGNNQ